MREMTIQIIVTIIYMTQHNGYNLSQDLYERCEIVIHCVDN